MMARRLGGSRGQRLGDTIVSGLLLGALPLEGDDAARPANVWGNIQNNHTGSGTFRKPYAVGSLRGHASSLHAIPVQSTKQ